MATVWNRDNRENLELLLKEGFSVPKISKKPGISPTAIYQEIKHVLTEEEYFNHQYVKYTAQAEIERQIRKINGELK